MNPLGGSTIYKFDYYLNDMPTALRNKVSAWQTAVTNAESNYADLTSDYNTARDTESDLKRTVEMYTYQIDKYTECKNNIVGSSGLPANVEAGFAVIDDDWFRVSSVITKAKNESGIQIEVTKVYSESRSISNNTSSTTYVPKGTSGSQIVALYIKDSDGKYIKKLTQTTASAVPTDCFRVNAANKVITFHTGQFANATQIAVFYHPVNEEVEEASVIITDLVEDLEEKITELEGLRTAANAQLSNATTLVNSLKSQREAIVNNLALDKYFTSSELDILSLYIYEGSYTDEYLTLTDSMSYSERVEELEALYQRGKTQLNKIATPTEKFSVDVENFIFQEKFSHWTESLETGVLIAVEIHPEEVADLFLTNFTVNYEDATMSMTFGNRYNKYDQKSLFENLLGQVKRSANTINFIKEQIYPVTSGELDDMKLALENMRTLSFGDALAAQNQSFIIDSTGITGTQTDDDGTVHDEQIKIINNMIVMTDDSWESCKLALGKIMTPGGVQRYGLNTEVLMGDLILGSQLRIKNNSNGLVFDDNGLEITNNVNTFRVNPNNSNQLLSISKDNSDLFYVDANGVLYLSNGIVIGGANGSTIGGFVIDVTSIHSDALNSTSSGSIGLSTLDFARTINNIPHNDLRFAIGGKFGVASNGTLYASNAVIDGTITSNNATITGGSIQISTSNQDDDIIQLNLQYDTDYGISSVDSSMRSGGFGVKEYTYDGKSLFIDNYLTMDFDYINGESVMKGLSDLGIRMTRVLPNENEEDILDISLANKSINMFNNPLRDFVIQELFNNYGWSVRKWYSGLLECWYKERFTSFSITTARGSVYRDLVTISDPNYPVSFIETPTVLACVNVNSGDGWGGYARDGDKDKMHTMYAYSAVSGSHNLTVQIYVVGRWKQ